MDENPRVLNDSGSLIRFPKEGATPALDGRYYYYVVWVSQLTTVRSVGSSTL